MRLRVTSCLCIIPLFMDFFFNRAHPILAFADALGFIAVMLAAVYWESPVSLKPQVSLSEP